VSDWAEASKDIRVSHAACELCAMDEELTLMRCYYVDSYSLWFVVKAKNKRAAYSEGVKEFGRGMVKSVRLATQAEVEHFVAVKSERDGVK